MRLLNKSKVLVIILAVLAFIPTLNAGAKLEIRELPLVISIVPSQSEVICGAVMQWNLQFDSSATMVIDQINLIDQSAWIWSQPPSLPVKLTDAQSIILELSVIPLVPHPLQPGVRIIYHYNSQTFEQIATGDIIQVDSIPDLIQAELIPIQKTVKAKDKFIANLWFSNQTPFDITIVSLEGGIDMIWEKLNAPIIIPPRQIRNISLQGAITGNNPQHQAVLYYQWIDAAGHIHVHSQFISGAPLLLLPKEPQWWEGIPLEIYTAIVGLITGLVTSLAISWSKDALDRQMRKKYNRNKVRGMLTMQILQAELAAEKGFPVNAAVIETIFQSEELYAVLAEWKLCDKLQDLWKTAQEHNQNINRPAGAQRSNRLSETAKILSESLHIRNLPIMHKIWYFCRQCKFLGSKKQ